MVESIISGAIFGFIGGVARTSFGLVKAIRDKTRFNFKRFIITLCTSIIIGIFTGILYNKNYKVSLLAGYAGTDILEGFYKISKRKV
jgi:fluoride ion exporter CrcB/FEX